MEIGDNKRLEASMQAYLCSSIDCIRNQPSFTEIRCNSIGGAYLDQRWSPVTMVRMMCAHSGRDDGSSSEEGIGHRKGTGTSG